MGPYFSHAWIRSRADWRTFSLSALSHGLLFLLPITLGMLTLYRAAPPTPPRADVRWMGSSQALLPYIPALRKDLRKGLGSESAKRGADAFNPVQTIISKPKLVNHPRQTLIQPAAPAEPPKILPPLPDIVQWTATSKPAPPPRRHLQVNTSQRMQQKINRQHPRAAAPEVHSALPEINLTSEHPDLARPALEVQTNARPTFNAEKRAEDAAPDISAPKADLGGQKIVALSENPAPPPPELQVPSGNLGATFVASPEGNTAGAGGTASAGSGVAASRRSGGGKGAGIPGVAIVGKRGPSSNIAGPGGLGGNGIGLGMPRGLGASDQPMQPGTLPAGNMHAIEPSIEQRIKSANQPEDLLQPGRIYTLKVMMPNLASMTGTWTLKFVELDENGKEIPGTLDLPGIAGPVPLRKVDPKYPPAFISAHVQGDVILYAIIRRDGSVDSIQVVRSLDPQLDQNAMEALARWKFQAAQREGHAVELATIVRIPFRFNNPLN